MAAATEEVRWLPFLFMLQFHKADLLDEFLLSGLKGGGTFLEYLELRLLF